MEPYKVAHQHLETVPSSRHANVAFDHRVLDRDRTWRGLDHAAQIDELAIAGALEHAPVTPYDLRSPKVRSLSELPTLPFRFRPEMGVSGPFWRRKNFLRTKHKALDAFPT
jgi:hypothetical protein